MESLKKLSRSILVIALLFIADEFSIILSYLIAYFIRATLLSRFMGNLPQLLPLKFYYKYTFLLLLWPIFFAYEGLYSSRFKRGSEFLKIFKSTSIAYIFTILTLFLINVKPSFSRSVLVISWAIAPFVVFILRGFIRLVIKQAGFLKTNLILIGHSKAMQLAKRSILNNPGISMHIIDHLDAFAVEKIDEIEKKTHIDMIITTLFPEIDTLVEYAETNGIELLTVADIFGLRTQGMKIEEIGSMVAINLKYNLLIPFNAIVKDIIERFLSLILVILLIPVFFIIAIVILLTSKGPVLFAQERVGKGGAPFNFYKFRTMYVNSESRLEELMTQNPGVREEWEKYQKVKSVKDPRVTKFGSFLRKFSLDELPQLFNVLKGDMSIVGPRPYLKNEITDKDIKKQLSIILSVKPGITGLWQVSGRNELEFYERLLLDEYYVMNWSISMDMEIILKTISVVLFGKGAY